MPLRAIGESGPVHSFEYDTERWSELKGAYKKMGLHMPCCQMPAIPKTSTRGNFFFAHARVGECASADESPEHLYCKFLVAKAAYDAGWTVTTERPGAAPSGEEWIADVFCEKGRAKLALEIQMSPQTDEETFRRQARYDESGVRGAWFFGHKGRKGTIAFDRDTPAFSMRRFLVGEVPVLEQFGLELPAFVQALLQKRITWQVPQHVQPVYVEYLQDICWACKAPVKQVIEHLVRKAGTEAEVLPADSYYDGRWHEPHYTVASVSNMLEKLQADIPNEELEAAGLNLVGRQDVIDGKAVRFPFCNLCLHCRAPQNNFYLVRTIHATRAKEGEVLDNFDLELFSGDKKSAPQVTGRFFGVELIRRPVDGAGSWALRESVEPPEK